MTRYVCECRWQPKSGATEELSAFVGGFTETDEPTHVVRFYHKGDILPGYHLASSTTSWSSFGGSACESDVYEVLIESHDCEFTWVPGSHGFIGGGAVRGGKTSTGEILYVGRVKHEGSWILGKIHRSHYCCYYCLDGKEHKNEFYEVLTCNLIKHGISEPMTDDEYHSYDDDDDDDDF